MTLRKAMLLFLGLGLVAFLVACSSSSHPTPTIAITATSGGAQSATVGTAFANPLVATVTSNGSSTGLTQSVIFTAPASGASCTFSNNTNTETDPTTNGVATSSPCTANTTAGGPYSVTAATSGATTNATFSLTNTPGTAAGLAVSSGNNQSATVSTAFGNALAAQVTDADGNPVASAGVSVTFTANTGGTGATAGFSGGTNTDTELTNSNGVATTSQTLTANATPGAFTVTAAATGLTSATFNLTNTTVVATLGNGNYAYTLNGLDTDDYSLFYVAGVITVSGGAITGGEQDYVDYENYSDSGSGGQDLINPTGSSITATADGNLQIVLNVCSGSNCSANDTFVGVAGVETINATLRPTKTSQAVLAEFDASGTATGELRQQDTTAAATTPSQGYAFQVSGFDANENILNLGGILNVDGAGKISGTGSIFDANDDGSGTTFQGETLAANTGTVSAPDAFGRVVFSITPSDSADFAQIIWVGYIVDSSRVYLVETADSFVGTTGGIAYSQGAATGMFSSSLISGLTAGAVFTGFDSNGALQTVGELTFNSGGTVTGFIDFNDLSSIEPASPDPVSAPSYTVDSTGRVTIAGLTDGVGTTLNLQLYVDANGDVVALSLDTTDNLGAILGGVINNSGVTDANFSGNYAMVASGWDGSETGEFGAVGLVNATGAGDTFSGFADLNFFNSGSTTSPIANQAVSGSYTLSANAGILTPSFMMGLDIDLGSTQSDAFNFYEVDTNGDTVAIETDFNQLTFGFLQQ